MQLQFTDSAKAALSHAEKTARKLQQGYVGTEHILIGLLKEGNGVAAKVLFQNGVDEKQVMEYNVTVVPKTEVPYELTS